MPCIVRSLADFSTEIIFARCTYELKTAQKLQNAFPLTHFWIKIVWKCHSVRDENLGHSRIDTQPEVQRSLSSQTVATIACLIECRVTCLKRAKTHLRSTISEHRLSNLACISINREHVSSIAGRDLQRPFLNARTRKIFNL